MAIPGSTAPDRGHLLDRAVRDLLGELPVALVAFDESGLPVWWNGEAEALLGTNLAAASLGALEARAAQTPEGLRLRTVTATGGAGPAFTWVVAAEGPGGDLLEAFAHQALHDHLTGLPNRTLLNDRIRQALTRASRSGGAVAVAFLDLDHFKLINDTQGHAEGDALLRAVADRLHAAVRESDTVARFGGDEFVVVCEDVTGAEEAMTLAERLRQALDAPFQLHGEEVFVSASLGVTVGGATDTPEELLRDADAAMYHAKIEGRARAELFDDTIRRRAARRRDIERALRRAIEGDQLRLVYQPIVSLEAGWVVGAEALLRWHHPEEGLLLPGEFIPVAEETGLIGPLGRWVLEEACGQLSRWRAELPRVPLFMSVNVSAREVRGQIADVVARCAASHGLHPSSLVLEITEGVLMDDVTSCLGTLQQLKAIGAQIAVDDFGVGYSSLGYLKQFPIDIIKIDRSFTAGLGADANDAAIVSAIAGIARALRVSVVAEGVETPEQLYVLRRIGCQQAQGFHLARPLPPKEFAELLRAGPRW
ncbi:MAG: EAL domain-containing protein [Acidimicrobiia bacterium]|nr:EAL domain-containing protein [Acidimicrobiia bacterium]